MKGFLSDELRLVLPARQQTQEYEQVLPGKSFSHGLIPSRLDGTGQNDRTLSFILAPSRRFQTRERTSSTISRQVFRALSRSVCLISPPAIICSRSLQCRMNLR